MDFIEDCAEGYFVFFLILLPVWIVVAIATVVWVFVVTPIYNFLKRKGWLNQAIFGISILITIVSKFFEEKIGIVEIVFFAVALLLCVFFAWLIFDVIIGSSNSPE